MAYPKRRPPELRLLGGESPGRDSGGRKVEPGLPAVKGCPPAPRFLPKEARAEWKRITPELARLGILAYLDRASLTAYCLTWWRLVEAQHQLNEEGVLGVNSQGTVRHPAAAVIEAASKELRAWCGEFGLTPSARGRMTVPDAKHASQDLD